MISRVSGQASEPPRPPPGNRLSNIQKILLVQETIEREIRPVLKMDGGDIELVDMEGNNVIVALRGTCSHCRVASFTLRDVVQAKLREFVLPDLNVIEA
ncbi:MAG: NifU family protein [Candidatus Riflebacteria bacterium]|nr:NifU family protein [Candidatus Riflebacteria bacterium]